LIRSARAINDAMPEHVLSLLAQMVAPPAPVALLGLTYKAEVDDNRESPAIEVARRAVEVGYDVRLCDPHVQTDAPGLPAPVLPIEQALSGAQAVVLLVDHKAFADLDLDLVAALVGRKQVLDTRCAIDRAAWAAHGFVVRVLGSGVSASSATEAQRRL
jgi:UDP-N-acetyl-D-mannosaminuronic acid dehydrogenase